MKKKICGFLLLLCMMVGLLTGCGNKESQFQSYIQSLITANYLGTSDEYIKTTGVNQADAEALYLQNATRLANNLNAYYGLDITNDTEMGPRLIEVSKLIYSKIRYEVSPTKMVNGIYYVDITIHPINILNDTHDKVVAYVHEFNEKVATGAYNSYSKEDYRRAFASGILDILEEGAKNLTYQDPQTVTVRIIEGKTSFYISDDDLRAIDELVIATLSEENKNPEPATEDDGSTEETTQSWG